MRAALAALVLALGWPAAAAGAQAEAAAEGRMVPDAIVGFTFVRGAASRSTPGQPFQIRTGDTVTWTNLDVASHDVTFDALPFSFYLRQQGESAQLTFDRPGYFTYSCVEHPEFPGMRGLVIVSGGKRPGAGPQRSAAPGTRRVALPGHARVPSWAGHPDPAR